MITVECDPAICEILLRVPFSYSVDCPLDVAGQFFDWPYSLYHDVLDVSPRLKHD